MTFVKYYFLTVPQGVPPYHSMGRKKGREAIYAAIDHSDIRGLDTAGQWDRRELPLPKIEDQ